MSTDLSVDDFYYLEKTNVLVTTKVTTITSEGGLLSPVWRFLFGAWVQTEVTTILCTENCGQENDLADSLLEYELEQLTLTSGCKELPKWAPSLSNSSLLHKRLLKTKRQEVRLS